MIKIKLKPFLNDLKSFAIHLVIEPFETLWEEMHDIWKTVTKKPIWVKIWALLFGLSVLFGRKNIMYFALAMFVMFYVVYKWQKGDFKDAERTKFRKKHGLKKFKKKKQKR